MASDRHPGESRGPVILTGLKDTRLRLVRLCRNSEMLGANPKGPGFASPFSKGGSRGILKDYIALDTQNLPCPPLRKMGGNSLR